jgi:hypothetical protein
LDEYNILIRDEIRIHLNDRDIYIWGASHVAKSSVLEICKPNGQEAKTAWHYGIGLIEDLKKYQETDNLK